MLVERKNYLKHFLSVENQFLNQDISNTGFEANQNQRCADLKTKFTD